MFLLSKFKKENNVNTKDVIPMNKDFTKVKQILTPLLRGGNIANKLSLLQNSEQTIQNANVANIELFKNLMLEIQDTYQNGKQITPLQLFQFFQLQTGVVKGLRALSGFDYLYLIDGNQDIESFKNKRLSKENFLKLDTEQQDASIQEFIDEFPEFKDRYDIRLKQNIQITKISATEVDFSDNALNQVMINTQQWLLKMHYYILWNQACIQEILAIKIFLP